MKLSLLVTKHHRLLSLIAALDFYNTVNKYLVEDGKSRFFDISLIGLEEKNPLPEYADLFTYEQLSDGLGKRDLIFIPAFNNEDMQQNIGENMAFIPFLVSQYSNGASLISLCTGSFLLAASGLLNGKAATTHIDAVDRMAEHFPEIKVAPQAILTHDQNIYTSGGATSSFHLKLYIVQQFCGREIAVRTAKNFAIDLDRKNQLHFERFKPELADDELVRSLQMIINENFSELKNVEDAFEKIPSSKRTLIRRFKQATGTTPIKYLQKTKIEAAKRMLETTEKEVSDIMLCSGYNDAKNFRQLFKTLTGLTPKRYREKYGMKLG